MTKISFLPVLGARNPRSKLWQGWFPVREGCVLACLLSCVDGCLLCVFTWFCLGACVCVLIASSIGVRRIL